MTNLNLYFTNFNFSEAPKVNFSHDCPVKIKGLIWINNRPFWTHKCPCGHYYFEKGQTQGGFYD